MNKQASGQARRHGDTRSRTRSRARGLSSRGRALEQRPELGEVILERGAGEQQPVAALLIADGLEVLDQPAIHVLEAVALVDDHKLRRASAPRHHIVRATWSGVVGGGVLLLLLLLLLLLPLLLLLLREIRRRWWWEGHLLAPLRTFHPILRSLAMSRITISYEVIITGLLPAFSLARQCDPMSCSRVSLEPW